MDKSFYWSPYYLINYRPSVDGRRYLVGICVDFIDIGCTGNPKTEHGEQTCRGV